jgi:hypothetical protein
MRRFVLAAFAVLMALPCAASAQLPVVPLPGGVEANVPPKRDTEVVTLRGSDFPTWSARSNQTAKLPLIDLTRCQSFDEKCDHNNYAEPEFDTSRFSSTGGVDPKVLLAYRWDGKWKQIPFQVDEVFTRYLDNAASGFSVYSGEDQHTTYAYDREGFRYSKSDPDNPCLAVKASPEATDPIPGLDDNDELVFMNSDAGDRAPQGTEAPNGIAAVQEVQILDPANPSAAPRYAYVMQAAPNGPKPAFDAGNGYVSYKRDKVSETFERSVSSYGGYGNAAAGTYCDKDGNVVKDASGKPKQDKRRPRDYATIKTDRYRWRYDGRWLMTEINISPDKGKTYDADVVDRWKARAFAQDPASETPCCGYEEEDTNWGGSSTLLGERVGPVRAIRETWGADSGTNVIRRETFYRAEMRQKNFLRVHVIPPLDGIYAQWDFNAGRMKTYYNATVAQTTPEGLKIDGRNDEAYGNFDDPCNQNWDKNDTTELDQAYRSFYAATPACAPIPCPEGVELPEDRCSEYYHQSVDVFDATIHKANVALEWNETAGPHGTIVDRITTDVRDTTPGGAAQSLVATPYYRDDSCFDDGTGTDPGPKIKLRSADEPKTAPSDGTQRKCWEEKDGLPNASDHFFQGSIGTHGLHLLFLADSDNARQTVPLTEIVSDWRMVMLPGDQTAGGRGPEAGQEYGEAFSEPVEPAARPAENVVDRDAPTVKLRARRHPSHHRIHLTYSVYDTGGSGLKSLTLQVKEKGRWRTLRTGTKRRSWNYKARKSGRYSFRLRAEDNAGNSSAWKSVRVQIRNSRFRGPGHKH